MFLLYFGISSSLSYGCFYYILIFALVVNRVLISRKFLELYGSISSLI
jgi:hypothetical protein